MKNKVLESKAQQSLRSERQAHTRAS